jgi:hypothetical protein
MEDAFLDTFLRVDFAPSATALPLALLRQPFPVPASVPPTLALLDLIGFLTLPAGPNQALRGRTFKPTLLVLAL